MTPRDLSADLRAVYWLGAIGVLVLIIVLGVQLSRLSRRVAALEASRVTCMHFDAEAVPR